MNESVLLHPVDADAHVPAASGEIRIAIAIIGAGPVGLALALRAAQALPAAQISLFDARPLERDVSSDPRTLALSLGSVQLLQRLGAWETGAAAAAQPITEVHVSQQAPSLGGWLTRWVGPPEVRIRAADEGVAMLGAVQSYGGIVAPLQRAWEAACAREPGRLACRFGTPVASLKALAAGVEVDAGIAETFDLAVVAEGGVFTRAADASAASSNPPPHVSPDFPPGESAAVAGHRSPRGPLRHDYGQTAWVGTVALRGGRAGVAYERFTRHGPAALLPLPNGRAALVWCVASDDDPVRDLNSTQRCAVLNHLFAAEIGELTEVSPLKPFALGLSAERSLTEGRTVRIGNAAQTLHPVAGQGLNLGLRDAFELVRALAGSGVSTGVSTGAGAAGLDTVLQRLDWQRAPDRWALIAATDFLARSFTWQLPGAAAARGLGLAALQALRPVKSALTRQMMFGRR